MATADKRDDAAAKKPAPRREQPSPARTADAPDDAPQAPEPELTVEQIDAKLRDPNFDPIGHERRRLADLSNEISRRGHPAPQPSFGESITRGDEGAR